MITLVIFTIAIIYMITLQKMQQHLILNESLFNAHTTSKLDAIAFILSFKIGECQSKSRKVYLAKVAQF